MHDEPRAKLRGASSFCTDQEFDTFVKSVLTNVIQVTIVEADASTSDNEMTPFGWSFHRVLDFYPVSLSKTPSAKKFGVLG